MNFKTTAMLLVILVVLGGFVFLMKDNRVDPNALEAARKLEAEGIALFKAQEIDPELVDTVVVTTQGKTATLTRKGEEWRQVEPVDFSLSSANVENVINTVAGLRYTSKFQPGAGEYPAASKIGLENADIAITLSGTGKKVFSHRVNVGQSIVGGKLYISKDQEETAYVVSDELASLLANEPVHRWRIRSLPAPVESQVNSVTLLNYMTVDGGTKMQLVKTQGQWAFGSPDSGRVDRQAVSTLLSSVATTTISRFVADAPADLSDFGLTSPMVQLSIVSIRPASSGSTQIQTLTQTLNIGAPADLSNKEYYATWSKDNASPAVFTISKEMVDRYLKPIDAFRDPSLASLKAGDIKHVVIEHSSEKAAFIRSANGWEFDQTVQGNDRQFQADDGRVADLVTALTSARATSFTTPAIEGSAPMVTVTLSGVGQAQKDVLRIWAVNEKDSAGKEQWLVLRNDEPVGAVVAAEPLKWVIAPAWQYRDRELADLPADKINRIELTQINGKQFVMIRQLPTPVNEAPAGQTPRDSTSPWILSGPDGAGYVDPALPGAIVAGVSPLRVAAWQAPGTLLPANLSDANPYYDLKVFTSDGSKVHLWCIPTGEAAIESANNSFTQTFKLAEPLRHAMMGDYTRSAPEATQE